MGKYKHLQITKTNDRTSELEMNDRIRKEGAPASKLNSFSKYDFKKMSLIF